jgi:cytochrome c oxidase accessory protein FixG
MNSTATQNRPELIAPEERVLSTLERDGSRRWLHPRLSKGKFWQARRVVSYLLILIFAAIPHISIKHKPAIFLDIVHRKFTLFGFTFLPTDTFLLALFSVSVLLGIFFVTALFGRVWCGWACPQTVYMEFLFRPIERLCSGRMGKGGEPSTRHSLVLRGLRFPLYLLACLFLAHTFLAYFVGVDQLRLWVTQSPFEHPMAFVVMATTTGLMMFDFCYFREQTCIIACPYGRLQSVLLDRDSLLIGYDKTRGEPRSARKKTLPVLSNSDARTGDCIDCTLCVQVCPTGIDIRQGLQIECIGCAQCIDACNDVMAKIGRPLGLIRYQNQNGMDGQKHRLVRPRLLVYLVVMTGLISLLVFLIATKSSFDMVVLRNVGRPFFFTDNNLVANEFLVKLTNRTDKPLDFNLSIVADPDISIRPLGDQLRLEPGQMMTEPAEIDAPATKFVMGSLTLKVRSTASDGTKLEQKCDMLGPFQVPTTNPSTPGDAHGD